MSERLLSAARYVPEIQLGHILQVGWGVLSTLMLATGVYFGVIVHLADDDKKLAVHDQRFVAVEASVKRIDLTQQAMEIATAKKLDDITGLLADLRVKIAELPHEPMPRR